MNRGFTLIEVLIAMVILSIAFVVLIKSVNQSVDMATRSKFITTSTLLAQKRIADVISSTDARTPGTTQGDFGEDYPGYKYTEKIEPTPLE
jgi:type II secretion system protein I